MGLSRDQLMWTAQELSCGGYKQPPMCEDRGLQYVVSLYWAVTTLTTMGYGDIGSQQPWEYAFSVVVMLMGVSCYAYIASNISIVLSSLDQEKTEMRDHLDKLEHFMFHKRITRDLRRRLRAYFKDAFCSHFAIDQFKQVAFHATRLRRWMNWYAWQREVRHDERLRPRSGNYNPSVAERPDAGTLS